MPRARTQPESTRGVVERRVIVLGSTGSIGTQTLDVISHLNTLADRGEWSMRYRVVGLAAGRNGAQLAEQARDVPDAALAMSRHDASARIDGRPIRSGPDAAEQLVREVECDLVLAAIVGSAGLPATLAAVELGRDVALANKETLVAAGALVVPAAAASGSRLLAVDSEHSALWQALQGSTDDPAPLCPPCGLPARVSRLILTASGGAFRTRSKADVYNATPAEALNHPTWSMGPKVTIDSATLTNKALEVLEAHWLFGARPEQIGVLIHPQSIVHSLVEYVDGSVLAQLGVSDMRAPIQYALTFPHRPAGAFKRLDLAAIARLDFSEPDLERFPSLGLAWDVMRLGGTAGAIFNAANEAAVEAFIDPSFSIPFGRIPELTAAALRSVGVSPLRDLRDVADADRQARDFVRREIGRA
jgi:1-deoxy-D-xylulose-5-phosphate reductoisomerase